MTVNKDIFEAKTLKAKIAFAWVDVCWWVQIRVQKMIFKLKGGGV
jgi:hypothetical protein